MRTRDGVRSRFAAGSRDVELVERLARSRASEWRSSMPCGTTVAISRRDRSGVAHGDLDAAGALAGRRYGIRGTVVRAQARQDDRYTTINSRRRLPQTPPPDGVYAVQVIIGIGKRDTVRGMMNQGPRRIGDQVRTLEVHLSISMASCTDRRNVEWVRRLRDVQLPVPRSAGGAARARSPGRGRPSTGRARRWGRFVNDYTSSGSVVLSINIPAPATRGSGSLIRTRPHERHDGAAASITWDRPPGGHSPGARSDQSKGPVPDCADAIQRASARDHAHRRVRTTGRSSQIQGRCPA